MDGLHKNATDSGLRVYHYGTTVNNPIGRAYYGLYNSISILVETRGIGAGSTNFARRGYSQQNAAHSIIDYAVANDDAINKAVADARAQVAEDGKVFDAEDTVILQQVASGKTQSPTALTRYQYNMDGSDAKTSSATLSMNDTVVRSRIRPTAYVIPKDIPNAEKILYILQNQGAEYYELEPGSTAELKQYYYVGEYTYNEKKAGFTADLRDAAKVTFEKGAYVIPMDQVSGNVIAMIMEPDVNDSNGYDGTLVQYGVVPYDKTTKNFPIYRYEGNDPRTTLVSNAAEQPVEPETPEQPTEPEQPVEPEKPAGSYTVKAGDSLWSIAQKHLGAGTKWEVIYKANQDLLQNPNQIQIGQVLTIPAA